MNTPFTDVTPMTERERWVLTIIHRHNCCTAGTLQADTGLSAEEVGQAVRDLVGCAFVRRESAASAVRLYHITELGRLVASSPGMQVYLSRAGRRKPMVPIMTMAAQRINGATVGEITDTTGYLNEQTVQRHLRVAGMTGKPGRPRKEASA